MYGARGADVGGVRCLAQGALDRGVGRILFDFLDRSKCCPSRQLVQESVYRSVTAACSSTRRKPSQDPESLLPNIRSSTTTKHLSTTGAHHALCGLFKNPGDQSAVVIPRRLSMLQFLVIELIAW
ncbi:unnamed protein product [Pleuronectes platessa]|uniref:Uncharacterized protein n=1 Tax=Pleuronectes platessa TaxID=8262 RepID=A0A9N7VSF2_PLEPL|nr:unnamed protein product [Pleuronectes platessa]